MPTGYISIKPGRDSAESSLAMRDARAFVTAVRSPHRSDRRITLARRSAEEGESLTIAGDPRPARYAGTRSDGRVGSRSPAQIASLVLGAWWTINGIGALVLDANLATGHVHGGGEVFGLVAITVNGWHALFHLLPRSEEHTSELQSRQYL